MALQLKGDNTNNNNQEKPNTWDVSQTESNPWDAPYKEQDGLDETKVIRTAVMTESRERERQGNMIVAVITKVIIALLVCGLVIFVGKQIVSVVMPEGIDITAQLKKDATALQSELGETFASNPAWASRVYEYSESNPTFAGSEDIGVVYMDGRQIGVHIPTKTYTIFGTQVGDGEVHMYNNTTYPYDSFTSILSTMSEKATVYIYYNVERNDCIFFLINNTTNRIESMTYYYDYREVTETLSGI